MTSGAEEQAPLKRLPGPNFWKMLALTFITSTKHWEQSINSIKTSALVMYTVPQLN